MASSKLERDIRKARKKYDSALKEYREAREHLQSLVDIEEVDRLDEMGVKPSTQNVKFYGAYLMGVQKVCSKLLDEYFLGDSANSLSKKETQAILKACLEFACSSKLNAERWTGEEERIIFKPTKKDKKGNTLEYKAVLVEAKQV